MALVKRKKNGGPRSTPHKQKGNTTRETQKRKEKVDPTPQEKTERSTYRRDKKNPKVDHAPHEQTLKPLKSHFTCKILPSAVPLPSLKSRRPPRRPYSLSFFKIQKERRSRKFFLKNKSSHSKKGAGKEAAAKAGLYLTPSRDQKLSPRFLFSFWGTNTSPSQSIHSYTYNTRPVLNGNFLRGRKKKPGRTRIQRCLSAPQSFIHGFHFLGGDIQREPNT